ncbi:GNAT family protein [uncultured Pelagimonas sp.]|uniref:GNAT family N-acetyltransferase n=1 Tax=uncultured Pelagimonas sp. TaxID=1618102 RepID=UPI00261EE372|nr:GNAT family protein [uncultured Pelagimonas sp.]
MIVGRLLYGADDHVAQFVGGQIGGDVIYSSHRAIGVLSNNRSKLIAGVVYYAFDGSNILVDIAATSPHWCRKDILKSLFDYPFEQLGCRRLTSKISAENTRSLKLCEGLGFCREGLLREGGTDGQDAHVLGLLKSERRF